MNEKKEMVLNLFNAEDEVKAIEKIFSNFRVVEIAQIDALFDYLPLKLHKKIVRFVTNKRTLTCKDGYVSTYSFKQINSPYLLENYDDLVRIKSFWIIITLLEKLKSFFTIIDGNNKYILGEMFTKKGLYIDIVSAVGHDGKTSVNPDIFNTIFCNDSYKDSKCQHIIIVSNPKECSLYKIPNTLYYCYIDEDNQVNFFTPKTE